VLTPRVTLRALTVAALAILAIAAPAAGELAPRIGAPPYRSLAGPVFAGDAVVSGRYTRRRYEVVTMRGAERTVTPVEIPRFTEARKNYVTARLEASERRVVLTLWASGCFSPTQCRPGHEWTSLYRAVLTGPVGGDLTVAAGCTSAGACDAHPCPVEIDVDASEDAIAYGDCGGVRVRDYAAGVSPAARDYPDRTIPRLAGSILAASTGSGVTVSNWRSGTDLYTVPAERGYDVQADGKLAFDNISWASPSEPFAHKIVEPLEAVLQLRIGGDRIAGRFLNPPESEDEAGFQGQRFDVLRLAPNPYPDSYYPNLADDRALHKMDFDGTRVMWVTRRCRHAWLRTWDPASGEPSGGLPDSCPLPRVVPGSGRVDQERRLRLRLECAVPPGPACVGVVARVGRRGKLLEPVRYSIAEGGAKTLSLTKAGSLCRASRHRARARILLGEIRTVTARGSTAGLRNC
jgi:hypothetical protein